MDSALILGHKEKTANGVQQVVAVVWSLNIHKTSHAACLAASHGAMGVEVSFWRWGQDEGSEVFGVMLLTVESLGPLHPLFISCLSLGKVLFTTLFQPGFNLLLYLRPPSNRTIEPNL